MTFLTFEIKVTSGTIIVLSNRDLFLISTIVARNSTLFIGDTTSSIVFPLGTILKPVSSLSLKLPYLNNPKIKL
jgi:hypothetical protein